MKITSRRISVIAFIAFCTASIHPAAAQQIGSPCVGSSQIITQMSAVQEEGIIACLPDSNGAYWWQPTNNGVLSYDTTATCDVDGRTRWNGQGAQICGGGVWHYFNAPVAAHVVESPVGNLDGDGAVALCDSDEYVLSGGGNCVFVAGDTTYPTLIASYPVKAGDTVWTGITVPSDGWFADCDSPPNISPAIAFVTCAKK